MRKPTSVKCTSNHGDCEKCKGKSCGDLEKIKKIPQTINRKCEIDFVAKPK